MRLDCQGAIVVRAGDKPLASITAKGDCLDVDLLKAPRLKGLFGVRFLMLLAKRGRRVAQQVGLREITFRLRGREIASWRASEESSWVSRLIGIPGVRVSLGFIQMWRRQGSSS